jgi:hypothetical protein
MYARRAVSRAILGAAPGAVTRRFTSTQLKHLKDNISHIATSVRVNPTSNGLQLNTLSTITNVLKRSAFCRRILMP